MPATPLPLPEPLAVRLFEAAAPRLAPLFRRPFPPTPPRRVVVIKPCCLGDVLAATAALAALHRAWPETTIDFVVGAWSRPALQNNPHVHRLVEAGRVAGAGRYTLGEYLRLAWRLRQGGYDCALVFERSFWLCLLPWLAGIPHRVGLDSAGRGATLTVAVPVTGLAHEVDRYLACLQALGLPTEGARPEFFPAPADRTAALAALQAAGWRGGPLAVVHPGGGSNPGMVLEAKRWPPDRYAQIIARLHRAGYEVALVGAAADRAVVQAVRQHLTVPALDLSERLTFGQLGALLQRASLFLGNDSGTMHLAVAVGTPAVAIFGPSDPRVYGPYCGGQAVWAGVPCSPCFDRGWWATCPHRRCLTAVTVDQVWAAVERLGRATPACSPR